MGTTNKMGIPYPESTDAVANGATAMENLATTVDTKAGLVKVGTYTPTPATVISVSNAFDSKFANYLVICTPIGVASASDISLRLLVGASASSVGYYLANIFVENTSIQSLGENNTGSWRAMNIGSALTFPINSLKFDLYGPAIATNTRYQMNGGGWSGTFIRYRSAVGFHDVPTSYDGFQLIAGSNITATINVYGYN